MIEPACPGARADRLGLLWGYFYFVREYNSRIIDRKDTEACAEVENLLKDPEIARILETIVSITIMELKKIYPKINSLHSKGMEKIAQLISESAVRGFGMGFIEDEMKAEYHERNSSK